MCIKYVFAEVRIAVTLAEPAITGCTAAHRALTQQAQPYERS